MKINKKLAALLLGISLSVSGCANEEKEPELEKIETSQEDNREINAEPNLQESNKI